MTNPTSYALLDAYYDMNLPQPILSVKLLRIHRINYMKALEDFYSHLDA